MDPFCAAIRNTDGHLYNDPDLYRDLNLHMDANLDSYYRSD
jgi:hypothetical protein